MSRKPLRNCAILISVMSILTARPALSHPIPEVTKLLAEMPKSPTHDRIKSVTYELPEAKTTTTYKVFVPDSYRPGTPTPLIVALHAFGVTPEEFLRYPGLTELANQRGYIVVAPSGFADHSWYGARGPGKASSFDPSEFPNTGELGEKDFWQVLQRVRADYTINPKRMYLLGHSMGGSGTWYHAIKHPELWAAIAPIAAAFEVQGFKPLLVTVNDIQAIKNIPVIVFQGDADTFCPAPLVHPWIEKMKSLGMNYSYTEIPGADHWFLLRSPDRMQKIFDTFDKSARP